MSNFNLFYANHTASVLQPLLKIREPNLKQKNLRFKPNISPGIKEAVDWSSFIAHCACFKLADTRWMSPHPSDSLLLSLEANHS